MEVLKPIYMAPNMTVLTRMNVMVLIGCFRLQNEALLNGVEDMSEKSSLTDSSS